MTDEICTSIYTEDEMHVYVCKWDDRGAWLRFSDRHGSMSAALTFKEAQQALDCLQEILNKQQENV